MLESSLQAGSLSLSCLVEDHNALSFTGLNAFSSKLSPRLPHRDQEIAIDPWVSARQPEMRDACSIRITVTAEMNGVLAMGQAQVQVL